MTLINKLQLPTKVYPTPYTLQLLKQRSKVTVFKEAIIVILFGPCYGDVLCDVLPMDVCHLLLSRPWLFDNHVIHDRHANTYAFKHKGRSLVLTLLSHINLIKSSQ